MKVHEAMKRAFLDAFFDGGGAPQPHAIVISVDKIGATSLGDRQTVTISVNIVDEAGTPLICLAECEHLGDGDTITIADIHRAFNIRFTV